MEANRKTHKSSSSSVRAWLMIGLCGFSAINWLLSDHSTGWLVEAQNSCHLRELDLCAATLLVFTQSPSGLATSDLEINKQCVHLRDTDSCLGNYTRRCMTPIQRELVSFAGNSSWSLLEEYCTKGSRLRTNYLKHSSCLNQIRKKEHKGCMQDLQASLELLNNNGPTTETRGLSKRQQQAVPSTSSKEIGPIEHGRRLQLACCTYRRFESCLGGQIEKKCGKEAVQFINGLIRRVTSRLPEIMCRNYRPEGQDCRDVLPKSGTIPRGSKSNSILSRLLAAYASF